MLKNLHSKIPTYITISTLCLSNLLCSTQNSIALETEKCPDLEIVFARGSGESLDDGTNYIAWKTSLEEKLQTTSLNYHFTDLDYPAVAIGLDNFDTSIGALVGSGDAYKFGDSVNDGVEKLNTLINNSICKNTKYVIGGYSQGAMVISKSLSKLDAEKIIYAATFGDPKLYLPEGEGAFPAACKSENLSDYRMYVPDCYAYEGLLGSFQPYEPENFLGKLGTWCNKSDIFCSSHLNISDHLNYASDNLYIDAAKVIFDKTTAAFGIDNTLTSVHDTAILIDSTGSMSSLIDTYKAEALRLAKETLESGGRVALYDYRDLSDPYEPVEHCSFETCTLELFESELKTIKAENGGDDPESLLSASLKVMNEQTWQYGATKSVVVLTDANYLSPDHDSTTLDQVVKLSKSIDPVNFYVITNAENADYYAYLVNKTDGKLYTNFDELSLSTDFIMARFDSLPKVVESEESTTEYATLEITKINTTPTSAEISFTTDAEKTLIILNDLPLGFTTNQTITLENLNNARENIVRLVPYKNDTRGIAAETEIFLPESENEPKDNITEPTAPIIPKAPDTGQVKSLVL